MKIYTSSCNVRDISNEIITVYVIYQSHLLSPQHTKVIYATSVLIKYFRSHPLTMFASQLPYLAK
jgi:hypothetical protein